MRGKDFRRHHQERMKNKAKFVVTKIWNWKDGEEYACKNADSLKSCNCHACKNPRWNKKDRRIGQELRKNIND